MQVRRIKTKSGRVVSISGEDFEKLKKFDSYMEYLDSIEDIWQDGQIVIPKEVLRICVKNQCSLICAWRKHYGWTQQQFAKMLGITQGTLSEIEQAQCNHKGTLEKVAAALGLVSEQLQGDAHDSN